ncbi:MAG TPA: tetratricopeptide repeat protein, partial [Spirochaetota bacterium]|nr:tetratricopeptide repeat protein [Spirochaetota bacterium]
MFEIKKTGVKFNSSSNFYRFKSDEELLKLLSIQSKHEENPFYSANLFNRIGKIYLDENNFETAIEYFKKAIKLIDDELGIDFPDIEKTISYNMLGITYSLLLDYDTAILCHKRALFSLEYWFGDKEDYAEDISAELARTYDSIGTIFYKREEFDLAIVYHKKALAVREYIGYYISQPEISYRNLGLAYSNKDDHDQAIHYHKQALYIGEEIFPGVPYPEKDLIENYQIFGSMYHDQKELYIASECFKKALILAEKKNDIASHEQIATIYNNLGAVYYENNNIDNALNCSSKSLEIYSEIKNCNNRELAKTYNNIGIFFQIKGNLKTSLEYISKAAVIYEQEFGENDFETVKLYYNLANSYNETGDYDSAIIFFNKVISYYDKFDLNSIELADAFQGIGYTYLIKGEHKLVSDYYFKALDIKKKKYGDQHPLLADIFHSIGQMFYVIGDNDLRIEYYEKSVLCDNEKNIHYLADLGRAYLDFKKYSKSASLLLSTIRKNERFHYLNLLKSFYKESSLHIYHYTLSALFYLKDFNNFFNISESIHASEYLKRLSLRRVIEISEISVEDCFALLKYKDSIERISSQLNDLISLTSFDFKEKPEFLSQITALSTQMAQAESDFIALDNTLMSNEKYKQLRNPDIATIDEAKNLCGADGVILEYIIPPHKGEHLNPYILVISAEHTEVIELDKEYPYSEKIESLRE